MKWSSTGHLGRMQSTSSSVRIQAAVADVVPDGAVEQPGILEHHADLAADRVAGQIGDIDAVQQDAAAVELIEVHEQLDDGGLARAGGAYDGNTLARL